MKFLVVMFALVAAASSSPLRGTFDLPVVSDLTRPAVIPEEVAVALPGLPIIASPFPITPEVPVVVAPVAPIFELPGVGTFPAPIPENNAAISVESKPLVQIILNIVSDRAAEDLVQTIQVPSGITKPVGDAIFEVPSGITKPVGDAIFDATHPILELPAVEAPSGITKPVGEAPIDITRPILELPVETPVYTRPAVSDSSRPATDLIR